MRDTTIRLGQCNRCQAYVFMAMSSGVRSAADPAPASRDAYIAALTDGRRVFRLSEVAGRPDKLLTRSGRHLTPSFDGNGAQNGSQRFLVEHGCGGHQRNMITFTEVEPGPRSAPATHGVSRGGSLPDSVRDSGARRSPHAGPATLRRSEAVRCHICNNLIDQEKPFAGIHHGRWVWAIHEECP